MIDLMPKKHELKVGMRFCLKAERDRVITISEISHKNEMVYYTIDLDLDESIRSIDLDDFSRAMAMHYHYDGIVSSQKNEVVVKKPCAHLNVRKERYFSNHVYETCKDCGYKFN
jgi:hypothetical protein